MDADELFEYVVIARLGGIVDLSVDTAFPILQALSKSGLLQYHIRQVGHLHNSPTYGWRYNSPDFTIPREWEDVDLRIQILSLSDLKLRANGIIYSLVSHSETLLLITSQDGGQCDVLERKLN